jgi:hypothetical protein
MVVIAFAAAVTAIPVVAVDVVIRCMPVLLYYGEEAVND